MAYYLYLSKKGFTLDNSYADYGFPPFFGDNGKHFHIIPMYLNYINTRIMRKKCGSDYEKLL